MATIPVIKDCVALSKYAGVTLMIWGERGLGKSSLVKQTCDERGWGFIDFRASQIEASDLRGLPDKVDGRTVYLPPGELPVGDWDEETYKKHLKNEPHKFKQFQRRRKQGILFLDEVNRAQDDVLQAAFQLVLDKEIGDYTLPPGWGVAAAGNFQEGGYQVNGFNDAAFINRFCHTILSSGDPTFDDFIRYVSDRYKESSQQVIDFVSNNIENLDGKTVKGELGFTIQPSRRSWEAVIRVQRAAQEHGFSNVVLTEVIAGLVGRETAIPFMSYTCPVKPRDLMKDGVAAHHSKLKGLTRNQQVGLMWGLISCLTPTIDDPKTSAVALDYAEFMLKSKKDNDLVIALLRECTKHTKTFSESTMATAALTNTRLAQIFAQHTKAKGTFITALTERKELHELVKDAAWGTDTK